MEISPDLLTLCRHYWNIPVVAHLHKAEAGFVEIVESLALSRDSLSRTLGHLRSAGWITPRERAYGLSRPGEHIAPHCRQILDVSSHQMLRELVLRRWTLPIVSALHNWDVQFNQLKSMLPEITPRALTLSLKDMQAAGLIDREILPTFPPTPVYKLKPRGMEYLKAIEKIK